MRKKTIVYAGVVLAALVVITWMLSSGVEKDKSTALAVSESDQIRDWTPSLIETAFRQGDLDINRLQEHYKAESDVFKRAQPPYSISLIEAGPVEIVAISSGGGEFWKYLMFSEEREGTYLGHVDFRNNQNGVRPVVRVMNNGDHQLWIVLKALSGSAPGFSLEEETWYAIDTGHVREVLRYPTEEIRTTVDIKKVASNPPFFTHISSEVQRAQVVDNTFTVELAFTVRYTNGLTKLAHVDELFQLNPVIRYVLDESSSMFHIDTERSDRNNWHFAIWPDEMLREQYAELEQIATGTDDSLKEWLALMLDHLTTSSKKTTLLDLMGVE